MDNATIRGDHVKHLSYRFTHERMKTAIAARFPLEAVAIAERQLTDRLLSFALGHGAAFDVRKITLGQVAPKVAKICRDTQDIEGESLAHSALDWAAERNAVRHAIAKSSPGTGPKISAADFVEHAVTVAGAGQWPWGAYLAFTSVAQQLAGRRFTLKITYGLLTLINPHQTLPAPQI